MPESPPPELIDRLHRLGLAAPGQVHRVAARVRRLAKGLPQFESVWVDALAQAGVLTPFQAAEINAGRGDALGVGNYLLCRRLEPLGYASCYLARQSPSGRLVRLALTRTSRSAESIAPLLDELAGAAGRLETPWLAPVLAAGVEGDRIWAACQHVAGLTASEWMIRYGRFAPQAVLEIARQMLAGLTVLEAVGRCHGDVGAAGLVLAPDGRAVLLFPGLRGIVRPEEGYAHADLQPEAYDYLAPERVADGSPPTVQSDMYACGCLWWHLLTGRAPLPGGSALAKLRRAQSCEIPDPRRIAPQTPERLAVAVAACVARQPALRPSSMAELAERLGPPTGRGRALLARIASGPRRRRGRWAVSLRALGSSKQAPIWWAAAGACLVALAAVAWSIWGALGAGPPGQNLGRVGDPSHEAGRVDNSSHSEPPATPPPAHTASAGREVSQTDAVGDEAANERILSSGQPVPAESLPLRKGMRVSSAPGGRAVVVVPARGMELHFEGMRFENVDFLWAGSPARPASTTQRPAIIHVLASGVEFRGCSFQASRAGSVAPAAIRWTHPPPKERSETSLPSGRVVLNDCVFRNVDGAIVCETSGAVAVEASNILHLGSGPLVQLDHCPRGDEPVAVGLSEVTLRGSGPLVELRYDRIENLPGGVSIQADRCALVPGPQWPVLRFVGPESPERLLRAIQWIGQGSLVSPDTAIAQWVQPDGQTHTLDEAWLSMAGLVRSAVAFAGPTETGPAASRLVRWQAPLRSPDPPGIDPRRLSWSP